MSVAFTDPVAGLGTSLFRGGIRNPEPGEKGPVTGMVVSNKPWSVGPVPEVSSIVCDQVLAPHTPWGPMALHATRLV